MRMMPMANSITNEPPRFEVKKSLNNEPELKSFKSDYDDKVKNNVESKKNDTVEPKKNDAVELKQTDTLEGTKTDITESKQSGTLENKTNASAKDIKNIKPQTNFKKKDNTQDVDIESTIKQLLNKNSKDKTEPTIQKNKNVKKVSNKNNSEKEIKDTDKDTLNQSLASASLLQVENNQDTKITDKDSENSEIKEKDISSIKSNEESEVSNQNKSQLNIQKQVVSPQKKESKTTKPGEKNENNITKFKVNDVRTKNIQGQQTQEVGTENKVQEVKLESAEQIEGGSDKTIILGSTEISAEGEGGKSQAPVMKEFSSLLKQQLKDFGNNDIVKQSRFILKDNNVGEIKLILKPESLGQVKINLNLNENSLAGQIVVENNSVKEIFQENMSQLSKALEDQGYDSAKLELSLDDKGESNKKEQKQSKQYFSERLKRIDESGQTVRYGNATAGIDLTA